ncbi:hypothetical protein OYC64_021103 [Pagothenia borchgrevinki]|uniref:Uncharacterized protein n=1 Tax=Pagothenia borchgrevinki TaxID=8213 RepID=A0ABD2FYH1_PAGBO
MSSQQFPRHGLPASGGGAPQIPAAGNLVSINQQSNAAGPDADSSRDADRQQDHPPAGGGGGLGVQR